MTTAALPKPTKRNSVEICGQLWHFKSERYRSADTMGNYSSVAINATRYSDGRQVTGSSRESLVRIIAERIESGDYPEKLSYAAAVRKMVAKRVS